MMVIEMREAAKDKAFDLLEEIKDLGHKKKMALCELEDTLYECFESEDDREDDDDQEANYRRSRAYRSRRSSMRDHSDYEDDEMEMERRPKHYRRETRMRRY